MAVKVVEPNDYRYKNGKTRSQAGKELLRKAEILDESLVAPGTYRVVYDGKEHTVRYDGSSWSCDCEDQRSRAKGGCKHIWAVYWAMAAGVIEPPEELPKKVKLSGGPKASAKAEVKTEGFVGPQKGQLLTALKLNKNALLKGPTGTGKTVLVREVAKELGYKLGYVAGSESLQDIDFLGAFVKKGDSIEWVDGKLTKAFRLAQKGRVILFIDEINRIPSKHLNILIGVMNPSGGKYTLYNHLTGETIEAPIENLRFIGAMNEGGAYQVHPLDPALMRRFESKIQFYYLPPELEAGLIVKRTGLSKEVAEKMVKVANLQREAVKRGEYDFPLDTASLLNWAEMVVKGGLSPEEAAACTWLYGLVGAEMDGTPNEEQVAGLKKLIETVF
ncbi:ATPase associated with various cellular activities AAA_5 (plasmid) [Thermovibrio ammonificans HB-1]|uniref:ATPase associated with various cellular activities AAA_5 n=1 Tax=Thermovibrio ammonificans (strain DSM 15698 / JCM 12110 / HB-1) TaxID=648996 RepID=E8T6V8_THEA1|nr:AAA family ATPase [Thermovibrio ammonificans]ADU97781.1 ATPase associated with various cellular activities AAA_5 [Thermovibrio ammonificans HB-1]